MSEKLSALIDNELSEFEHAQVLKELYRDRHLSELWSRYHIIGLAMRREQVAPAGNLADLVHKRLEDEANLNSAPSEPPRRRSFLRPAGGLAAAASVAAVLLVGGLILTSQDNPVDKTPDTADKPQIAAVEDATRWEGADPQIADALNTLLIEHGEFTSASGMNGLTAYTKFVAYDSQ